MTNESPPLDSVEGMTMLIVWARAHGFVLSTFHRKLAEKHGVSVDGVRFSEPLPIHWHCGMVGTAGGWRDMTRDELEKLNG